MKFLLLEALEVQKVVTPLAGVWIEIVRYQYLPDFSFWSLPSRECGLKCIGEMMNEVTRQSLPSRECGLKCREQEKETED